jgi:divalent metal cation (Fe/Co/Zn/Cd) transporter
LGDLGGGIKVNKMNTTSAEKLLKVAFILSLITIGYNVIEGVVSTIFGFSDDTIALAGFGFDSFVEVISGIGIAHMVLRMRKHPVKERDRFERHALNITGVSFMLLTIGLVTGGVLNLVNRSAPETTVAGIIISSISIATMWLLYSYKMKTGRALNSAPIISDARCTLTCFYLSFILLGSSLIYEIFNIGFIDVAGAFGIAFFCLSGG